MFMELCTAFCAMCFQNLCTFNRKFLKILMVVKDTKFMSFMILM